MTYQPDMVVMDYVRLIRDLKNEREREFLDKDKIYGYIDRTKEEEQ